MTPSSQSGDSFDVVTLILGLLLIGAPWALGYTGDHRAAIASVVAGVAIATCAIVALSEFTQLFREVDIALGVLTAAAPWLAQFATNRPAMLAHVAAGGLVLIVSAGELWWTSHHPPPART